MNQIFPQVLSLEHELLWEKASSAEWRLNVASWDRVQKRISELQMLSAFDTTFCYSRYHIPLCIVEFVFLRYDYAQLYAPWLVVDIDVSTLLQFTTS